MQKQEIENESTLKKVGRQIEDLKIEHPDLTYIECSVAICEKMNIEIEMAKKILPTSIKEKIEAEALGMNLLTYKRNTLV